MRVRMLAEIVHRLLQVDHPAGVPVRAFGDEKRRVRVRAVERRGQFPGFGLHDLLGCTPWRERKTLGKPRCELQDKLAVLGLGWTNLPGGVVHRCPLARVIYKASCRRPTDGRISCKRLARPALPTFR